MENKWPWITVSELQEKELLLVEDGNHGEYRPRPDEFTEEGVPFIRAADIHDGRILLGSASRINEVAYSRIRKGVGAPGDVILSHKGTVGKVALAPDECEQFVCSPQTTFWRSLNREAVSNKYLYYFLCSPGFRRQLDARKGESDMADYVSLTAQRTLKIALPKPGVQRSIAKVLGELDAKIELNHQMKGTMEAIARAIFKSWFVDFDPVREGHSVFPREFMRSSLGPIPEGWSVEKLGDCCEFAYGKAMKAEDRRKGSVAVYGSNGQIGWHDEALVSGPGIVVGRKGNPGTVVWAPYDFFPIDTTFYVISRKPQLPLSYLFHVLESLSLHSLSADSAVPGLNRNMAYLSEILVPKEAVTRMFDELTRPLREGIALNIEESRTLAALRDALLPKLLSGEIRVKQAEKIVGEAVRDACG